MSGPLVRTYKAGSILYFEGDKANEVYVLQKGKIILTYKSLDQIDEIKENVQRGEFFGVKSSLGHYRREETAQVLVDSIVLVFNLQQFEALCLKNPRIVLQMLKAFSARLRKVHKKVRELLGEKDTLDSSMELVKVAETYYKHNKNDHAMYAFEAYKKQYPGGPLSSRVDKMLTTLKQGRPYPIEVRPIDEEIADIIGTSDLHVTSLLDQPASSAMDSDLQAPALDTFGLGVASSSNSAGSVEAKYYEALNDFGQENFDAAIQKLSEVLSTKEFSNSNETQFLEKAQFDIARAYQKKNDNSAARDNYIKFIKKYPRSDQKIKAMLDLAATYLKLGAKPKAIDLYQKVAAVRPKDKDVTKAEQKLKELVG